MNLLDYFGIYKIISSNPDLVVQAIDGPVLAYCLMFILMAGLVFLLKGGLIIRAWDHSKGHYNTTRSHYTTTYKLALRNRPKALRMLETALLNVNCLLLHSATQ